VPAPAKYDAYLESLAGYGQWEASGVLGRDAIEQVRKTASGAAVNLQAVELLQRVWAVLPSELRSIVLSGLRQLGQQIQAGAGALADTQGLFAGLDTIVAGIVRISTAAAGIAEIKRFASNYAHGTAQYRTCEPLLRRNNGFYHRVTCLEFAQYVKVRSGGDFDRKPCFSRRGGARDSIFLVGGSPPDDPGNCKKKMRRDSNDSYGPFEGTKCGRKLGISALLWPWWSAAYEPKPLPRWDGAPDGASFDPGLSPDTNARLVEIQTRLLTDPGHNLQSSFADISGKCARFLAWWDKAGGRVYPMSGGKVTGGSSKRIDPAKRGDHTASEAAAAYWYMGADGQVVPYDDQPGAELDRWGVKLPDGDPANLGVTIGQHNAVIATRAAFAERRIATLRKPGLVRGLIQDLGMGTLDAGARDAIVFARESSAELLPYPGARTPPKMVIPGRLPKLDPRPSGSKAGRVVVGTAVAGGVGAGLYFAGKAMRWW
jgi:hypothetical protein